MGDHLALLVDRLLTESTLEAAIGNRKQVADLPAEMVAIDYCCDADGGSVRKMVECSICQEEDWDTSMEAPCSCCGNLKNGDLAASRTKMQFFLRVFQDRFIRSG
ncbi:hypothetical protein ABZP36_011351 [Zizania latifolia]